MRKPMVAGNWKMNMKIKELSGYFSEFIPAAEKNSAATKVDICFAAPYLQLKEINAAVSGRGYLVAAQNAHEKDSGAFTGEISFPMLDEIGIKTVILGHSERREYYSETNESVALKTKKAIESSFLPIVCIGETKQEREGDLTEKVIKSQLEPVFEAISDITKIVIAYEPVWAIGTGLTATSEQAQNVHAYIRKLMTDKYGESAAQAVRILYGGSAKPENIGELISMEDIDGGLVGGASLKPTSFAEMVQIVAEKVSPSMVLGLKKR